MNLGITRVFFLATNLFIAAGLIVSCAVPAAAAEPPELENENTLYVVAASHLDTQWWWPIQTTINKYIPATFIGGFDLIDKYPDFVFGWEGAFRYMLLEEYYPELYDELLIKAAAGRWRPAGSAVDAGDVNVPSPESLMRQFLYGSQYFERVLGRRSADVFLPDCFGFGYALPSVAAHFGLKGFSTQKLTWGSAAGQPFDIGVWEGPDGNSLVAAINPGSYVSNVGSNLANDAGWQAIIERQYRQSGLRIAYRYYGTGDFGGSPGDNNTANVQRAIDEGGAMRVISAAPDQLFLDLTDEQISRLPRYKGELLLTTHGTGSYTSQGKMKRLNRRNELLADAAERSSVAADWLGGLPYRDEIISAAWVRFLAHQFHDDLTGTGTADIYTFSWNDEFISLNRFSRVLTESVGANARLLDRNVGGAPLVVYNPLSFDRRDIVRAVVRFPDQIESALRVFGPDGRETPSQVIFIDGNAAEIIFIAEVGSVGFAVYDVVRSNKPSRMNTGLKVGKNSVENKRYRVRLNSKGNIESIYDKQAGRELLSAPIEMLLFKDKSLNYPAWEIQYDDIADGPEDDIDNSATIEIDQVGPAYASLKVTRKYQQSEIIYTIGLGAEDAGGIVRFDYQIDWAEHGLLKIAFPLTVENETATYDLGLGVIERGNNTEVLYEVPAQQWVDLSEADDSFGVELISDSKYGWDKPDDQTLRLTLLHSPEPTGQAIRYQQDLLDWGKHRFGAALAARSGARDGKTVQRAAAFNQPLIAFQTTVGDGVGDAGRSFSLAGVSTDGVIIKALKKSEAGPEYVVRLRETAGVSAEEVSFRFGKGISEAIETNGAEQKIGEADISGGEIIFDLAPYQTRTFLFTPETPSVRLDPPQSRVVPLEYDRDVVSFNENRADGSFGEGGFAIAGEFFPNELTTAGAQYRLGPTADGVANAVAAGGQSLQLDPAPGEKLYLLASAFAGDTSGEFISGGEKIETLIFEYTGFFGQGHSRYVDGELLFDPELFAPEYVKQGSIAWVGGHRHSADGDDPYRFTYLFEHKLPAGSLLTLPENETIKIFAASLVLDENDRTYAAAELYDGFDPRSARIDWSQNKTGDRFFIAPETDEDSGCECRNAGGPAPLWVAVLLLAALRLYKRRAGRRQI